MPLILFFFALFAAFIALNVALVLWLATLVKGLLLPLIIVGLFYVVVSFIIYYVSIRRTLMAWQQRLDTIYLASATIEGVVQKAVCFIKKIVG